MRFTFTILVILLVQTSGTTQNLNKTELDFINADAFEPDGQIKGIGLVELNLNIHYYDKDLAIYDSNGNPKATIRVTDSDVVTKYGEKIYSRNDNSNPLSPRHFVDNPDYFRLIFDCLKTTDQYYQVILNNRTNETGFIKIADSSFKFETFANTSTNGHH
jgi:hypothetical protein